MAQAPQTSMRLSGSLVGVAALYFAWLCAPLTASAAQVEATAKTEATTKDADDTSEDDSSAPEVIEVQGHSIQDELQNSARAVTVVSTERDRKKSADLGELLARTPGVGVQRAGGLGSNTRFALNGLVDEQIRFFLDGVPLDLAGFPFGIANVPVNLVERVEIYRGVVPIEFGADALGGAVNVVSTYVDGTTGSASYQIGSFNTHRLTGDAQTVDHDSGWLVRATGFFDYSDNDYSIDVEIPNAAGRLSETKVDRFHDTYRAGSASVEFGVIERDWAERLIAKVFYTDIARDIQNNFIMTVPYGEVTSGELSAGGNLRYQNALSDAVELEAIAGYSRRRIRFRDLSTCAYNWRGECVEDGRAQNELGGGPQDTRLWDDNVFFRLNATVELPGDQTIRLSLSPSWTSRSGEQRVADPLARRDPFSAQRDLLTVVGGVEYEDSYWADRLENIAFAKLYVQRARSEERELTGVFARRDRDTETLGVGDSLVFRAADGFDIKASYEWATRLPQVEETFGDGVLILDNLELQPERSHNFNLGASAEFSTSVGTFLPTVNGFWREISELIVLLSNAGSAAFQNVANARSVGVEGSLLWTSPGGHLSLGANTTFLDFRNVSSEGPFGNFDGDRIPNRPYVFANGFARLEFDDVIGTDDTIAFDWNSRFVEEFFRFWESQGREDTKQTIDRQLLHTAAAVYSFAFWPNEFSVALEVQNITNARVFDFFGVQRPGRSLFAKITAGF
ncbi:MAG: TonB-dependent siderophore myxochelin receptor MxcH [Myxococcota bacterium]